MTTQSRNLSAQASPPPPLLSQIPPALLAKTSSVATSNDSGDFSPEMITVRATHISVVLRKILETESYSHGGLND